jgi:ABC-type uncharacterized transport system, permease and ATPase components
MNATPLQKHAVWQLIKPFWVSEERWRAWMMLIAIVILSLGLVYISVLINQWNQVFYDALQNKITRYSRRSCGVLPIWR